MEMPPKKASAAGKPVAKAAPKPSGKAVVSRAAVGSSKKSTGSTAAKAGAVGKGTITKKGSTTPGKGDKRGKDTSPAAPQV